MSTLSLRNQFAKSCKSLKVGIIQSNYLPWRGYFDFIDDVDLFIFYDDVQYTKGDWRNRNRIKTNHGLKWITVPIKCGPLSQIICETCIDYSFPWHIDHKNKIKENYRKTPFLEDILFILDEAYKSCDQSISELNIRLIKSICRYLQIKTPFVMSKEYEVTGEKTERLIRILNKVGATAYVSGPNAGSYLDEGLFRENGIDLEYKSYDYKQYNQAWGEFEGAVSVIDLIANYGPSSRDYLKSLSPNIVAVPN